MIILTTLWLATATACLPAYAQITTFSDPFVYCTSVGTIDAPDARYVGPRIPDTVAKGLQKAFNAPADAPLEPFRTNSFWRCMDGKVYACTVGANLPCQAKANTDRVPTAAEVDFCKANAQADFIPMAVTGRETVYEWRCRDGRPDIVRQMTTPDARGFLSNIWYELRPE